VSTIVADTPHKIFVGALPNYLDEDQVSGTVSKSYRTTRFPLFTYFQKYQLW